MREHDNYLWYTTKFLYEYYTIYTSDARLSFRKITLYFEIRLFLSSCINSSVLSSKIRRHCRVLFARIFRLSSLVAGMKFGRSPGNRVPRNYRWRNRFRDSLPECTGWNADSPRGTTLIYRNRPRNRARLKFNFSPLKVTFISREWRSHARTDRNNIASHLFVYLSLFLSRVTFGCDAIILVKIETLSQPTKCLHFGAY